MAGVGFVLGAGGLAGTAFHAGVITALWRTLQWDARDAQLLVGTSAGSTSAALLRAGFPPEDFLARMTLTPMSPAGARILASAPPVLNVPARPPSGGTLGRLRPASLSLVVRGIVRPRSVRPGAWLSALLPPGRVPTDETRDTFASALPEWPRSSLWVCALRLSNGQRLVFGRDDVSVSVADAVAASCAIPGYFAPVRVGTETYVDGGAHSFCNADLVAGLGLDAVIVSAPMSSADSTLLSPRHAWRTLARRQLASEVRQIIRGGTPVLLLEPTRADIVAMQGASLDASRRPEIARQVVSSVTERLTRLEHPVLEAIRSETLRKAVLSRLPHK